MEGLKYILFVLCVVTKHSSSELISQDAGPQLNGVNPPKSVAPSEFPAPSVIEENSRENAGISQGVQNNPTSADTIVEQNERTQLGDVVQPVQHQGQSSDTKVPAGTDSQGDPEESQVNTNDDLETVTRKYGDTSSRSTDFDKSIDGTGVDNKPEMKSTQQEDDGAGFQHDPAKEIASYPLNNHSENYQETQRLNSQNEYIEVPEAGDQDEKQINTEEKDGNFVDTGEGIQYHGEEESVPDENQLHEENISIAKDDGYQDDQSIRLLGPGEGNGVQANDVHVLDQSGDNTGGTNRNSNIEQQENVELNNTPTFDTYRAAEKNFDNSVNLNSSANQEGQPYLSQNDLQHPTGGSNNEKQNWQDNQDVNKEQVVQENGDEGELLPQEGQPQDQQNVGQYQTQQQPFEGKQQISELENLSESEKQSQGETQQRISEQFPLPQQALLNNQEIVKTPLELEGEQNAFLPPSVDQPGAQSEQLSQQGQLQQQYSTQAPQHQNNTVSGLEQSQQLQQQTGNNQLPPQAPLLAQAFGRQGSQQFRDSQEQQQPQGPPPMKPQVQETQQYLPSQQLPPQPPELQGYQQQLPQQTLGLPQEEPNIAEQQPQLPAQSPLPQELPHRNEELAQVQEDNQHDLLQSNGQQLVQGLQLNEGLPEHYGNRDATYESGSQGDTESVHDNDLLTDEDNDDNSKDYDYGSEDDWRNAFYQEDEKRTYDAEDDEEKDYSRTDESVDNNDEWPTEGNENDDGWQQEDNEDGNDDEWRQDDDEDNSENDDWQLEDDADDGDENDADWRQDDDEDNSENDDWQSEDDADDGDENDADWQQEDAGWQQENAGEWNEEDETDSYGKDTDVGSFQEELQTSTLPSSEIDSESWTSAFGNWGKDNNDKEDDDDGDYDDEDWYDPNDDEEEDENTMKDYVGGGDEDDDATYDDDDDDDEEYENADWKPHVKETDEGDESEDAHGRNEEDDDDEDYDISQWSRTDNDNSDYDEENANDAQDDFESPGIHEDVVDEELAKKNRPPTAPSSMVLFYTWMIVVILIMVVGISTYQSRCRGFKLFGSKSPSQTEDKKRLLEHEYV